MNKKKAMILTTITAIVLASLTLGSYAAWSVFSNTAAVKVDPDPIVYSVTMIPPANGTISDTYIFTGTVTADGSPLAGATVTLFVDGVATAYTDNTDGAGHFSITWPIATPGTYITKVQASGV